jgi:tetratricopeptide (TPR) repeat protein
MDYNLNMTVKRLSRLPYWLRRTFAQFYYWRGNFHRHFGNLSGERVEYEMAVNAFSRAIELHPDFVSAHYSRGILYWRELQNFHRAIRDLTRVIELAPRWHEAWLNRAIAYHLRGNSPQAIADLEHYLTVAEDPDWRSNAESQLALIKAVALEREEHRAQR